jgi:acetyl/propionyl-CoA carboxylase alpha subunit
VANADCHQQKMIINPKDIKIHRYAIDCIIHAKNILKNLIFCRREIALYYSPKDHDIRVDFHVDSRHAIP